MNFNSLYRISGRLHLAILLLTVACLTGCDTFLFGGQPSNTLQLGSGGLGATQDSDNGGSNPPATASVDASLLEQLSLERINRARLRPAEEAAAGGIAIDEGIPGRLDATSKPAVAMNARLRQSAIVHSNDMLDRDYFEHETPEGVSPFQRIQTAGYVFLAAGENLAWRGTTGTLDPVRTVESQHNDLFIDVGIPGRGHRVTMLNAQLREVGISIIRGSFTRPSDGVVFTDSIMQTQDYGTSTANTTFVLGVIYNDNNGNGQYDFGEGSANSTVSLQNITKRTNQAGGYSFEVGAAGTYTLRFASGQTLDLTIEIGDPNIKVDSVNGRPIVNLGLGLLN
ncbi:MAG: CAP domain-containing protein [Phycisphaerales bacterium]|nr:CAP domain-containing protein [Phycisphaerales bacterium]